MSLVAGEVSFDNSVIKNAFFLFIHKCIYDEQKNKIKKFKIKIQIILINYKVYYNARAK